MVKDKIGIKVILETRTILNNQTHSVKLRITFKRTQKYYPTKFAVTTDEWDLLNTDKAKGDLKKLKNVLFEIEKKAELVIENLKEFSFDNFESHFYRTSTITNSLKNVFETHIKNLNDNNQIGTSISYQTAYKSINNFHESCSLFDVNISFLKRYETWLLNKGRSLATVGIYMRSLRTIINLAIEQGFLKKDDYPFGKRKYQIPTGKNIKKALSKQELLKLYNYNCSKYSTLDKARDFWMFSYLNNGINFTDIAHIKWEQINENSFWFYREKTKNTRKSNPLPIQILLNATSNLIIQKWGNKNSKYVFDIILEKDNSTRIKQKIQQFIKVTNKWLDKIGMDLEFNQPLRTYSARHSYTSILIKEGNAPIEYVSQSLGHSSILTTQKYFSGFELSEQSKYSSSLL